MSVFVWLQLCLDAGANLHCLVPDSEKNAACHHCCAQNCCFMEPIAMERRRHRNLYLHSKLKSLISWSLWQLLTYSNFGSSDLGNFLALLKLVAEIHLECSRPCQLRIVGLVQAVGQPASAAHYWLLAIKKISASFLRPAWSLMLNHLWSGARKSMI